MNRIDEDASASQAARLTAESSHGPAAAASGRSLVLPGSRRREMARLDGWASRWSIIHFGRHAGKTLPKIALDDPDWVFNAAERGYLQRVARSRELVSKARAIRIPDGLRGPRVADYIAHGNGRLDHVEVDYGSRMVRDEDSGVWRRGHLDLSFAYFLAGGVDRTGSKAIVEAVRSFVFKPRGWKRMTAELCEAFFDDDANFVL